MNKTAETVAELYRRAKFSVRQVQSLPDLVDVLPHSLITCSDGRPVIGGYPYQLLGPKILGATPGQANLLAAAEFGFFGKQTTMKHLDRAIDLNQRAHHLSGFHDIHHDEVHCGQQDKMSRSEIRTLPKQIYTPFEASMRILNSGGQGVELRGGHVERGIIVNLEADSTRIADSTNFMIDLWYILNVMKISPKIAVASSIEIIGLLSPVRDLVVVG